jgi:hypothetical protein
LAAVPPKALTQLKEEALAGGVPWCVFYESLASTFLTQQLTKAIILDMIVKLDAAGLCTLKSFLDYIENPEWERNLHLKPGLVTLLRGLPEPALTFYFKITYKNKKGTTAESELQVDEKHMKVEFIYSSIQTIFTTKCARLGITIDGDELTDGTLQQCLEDPERQHLVSVVNMQVDFLIVQKH